MNSLGGNTTIAQKDIFINFPIINLSSKQQSEIVFLVDKILQQIMYNNDVSDIENEIDDRLYTYYAFSKEERECIFRRITS